MATPTVGSHVSHYRLERSLGAGGMGQVFLARDLTLDRPVAIKFLIVPQDEDARRRLLAEARAAHEAMEGRETIGASLLIP
jgi:serine/threonine protein kinase